MQLEPRDTRGIEKADEKEAEDNERGREIREEHAADATAAPDEVTGR